MLNTLHTLIVEKPNKIRCQQRRLCNQKARYCGSYEQLNISYTPPPQAIPPTFVKAEICAILAPYYCCKMFQETEI